MVKLLKEAFASHSALWTLERPGDSAGPIQTATPPKKGAAGILPGWQEFCLALSPSSASSDSGHNIKLAQALVQGSLSSVRPNSATRLVLRQPHARTNQDVSRSVQPVCALGCVGCVRSHLYLCRGPCRRPPRCCPRRSRRPRLPRRPKPQRRRRPSLLQRVQL